jgi:hypothetical protein
MISVGPYWCPRIERENFPSHDGTVSEDLDRELLPGSQAGAGNRGLTKNGGLAGSTLLGRSFFDGNTQTIF